MPVKSNVPVKSNETGNSMYKFRLAAPLVPESFLGFCLISVETIDLFNGNEGMAQGVTVAR